MAPGQQQRRSSIDKSGAIAIRNLWVAVGIVAGIAILYGVGLFAWGLMLGPFGSWKSYDEDLPHGGEVRYSYRFRRSGWGSIEIQVVWTTPGGVIRSFPRVQQHEVKWEAEFRARPDGKAVWMVSYLLPSDMPEKRFLGPPGTPLLQWALDLETGAFFHQQHNEYRDTEGKWVPWPPQCPDWATVDGGEPLGRWLVFGPPRGIGPPLVYLHWAPRIEATRVRVKSSVPGEDAGVVIESGDSVYRRALIAVWWGWARVALVDYANPEKPRVCASLDYERREFIDEGLFVWHYGEEPDDPITRSSEPAESYPAWAKIDTWDFIIREYAGNDVPAARVAE